MEDNHSSAILDGASTPKFVPGLDCDYDCHDISDKTTLVQENTSVQETTALVQNTISPAFRVQDSFNNHVEPMTEEEEYRSMRPSSGCDTSLPYCPPSPYPGWTPDWDNYTPYDKPHYMNMNLPATINRSSHAFNRLPLADNVCEVMFSSDFQHDWMITHNIDPAELKSFTSPMKLEQLIAKGVIKIGDIFVVAECCVYDDHDHLSSNIVKFATILSLNKDGYPNLRIEREGVFHSELKNCHGPTIIVKAFNKIDPMNHNQAGKAWTELEVYRNGESVESLWYLRNSFHLWEEERKKWIHRVKGIVPREYTGRRKWNRRG